MISFEKINLSESELALNSSSYFIKNKYNIIYEKENVGHIKEFSKNGKDSFLYNLYIPDNFLGNHKGFSEISRKESFGLVKKSLEKCIKSLINKCNK